ncbi:SCO3242 family prenyltransferase [Agromyces seonyuensis]|uniref:4-hydroxybenzoate polyprenyltransferase n=1 Tax=Agromyces seonyuensis TaxID=2662446 RepID=A0A6I4P7C7_9MICO|nr:UbiA family prenyltransferase [Agromyces seonyuensis]MWB99704.1 4-hydroxybenzoate polyprenyltransferase [Agromyces seonyuensis]
MTRFGDVLDLVRAPAVLTVLGDAVVGGSVAHGGLRGRGWLLPLASAAIYSGGMALNDYADRRLDALERPERPIPSGRIAPRTALGIAIGLEAVGVVLAAAGAGRRGALLALPLVAAVVVYDTVAKPTAAGPVSMAVCRGLDVLLGARGSLRALPAALTVATHTVGVTALSRGEVDGGTAADLGISLAATGAAAASIDAVVPGRGSVPAAVESGSPGAGRADASQAAALARAGGALGAAAYLVSALPGQLAALDDRTGPTVRDATRAGIGSVVPLQAALVARSGAWASAVGLAALDVLRRRLTARRRRGDVT